MKLKIGILQVDCQWEQPQTNIERVRELVLGTDAELIVMPEMFATGFSMNPSAIAQTMEGQIVTQMTDLAMQSGKALIFSAAIVNDKGENFNRLFFIAPDGTRLIYDKRHLFRMAGENDHYSMGEQRLVVHYKGFRICPLVCYDLRFPVWSRNNGDYDMLVYVASWPDARIYAWDTLLKARAIENQCFVVAVNRVGDDPKNHYSGHSVVLDYLGCPIVATTPEAEQVVVTELEIDELNAFRDSFPAHMDADNFTINEQ